MNKNQSSIADFREYTATVKTDCSYYGDATPEQAQSAAEFIGDELKRQFPGIRVEYCDLIGHGNSDDTQGPDSDVCDDIDRAHEKAWQEALDGDED